jgi:methylated-DNA-[protein]-cysteine S-methyltransferase
MKDENRVVFTSRKEARQRGYRPCKICLPDGVGTEPEKLTVMPYCSPLGEYLLISSEYGLVAAASEVTVGRRRNRMLKAGTVLAEGDGYNTQASSELDAYFSGKLTEFSVTLDIRGTDFQRNVWQILLQIPYGETRTYGWVAQKIGRPQASRAAGRAIGTNPLGIIVPCHRVIGSDGSLTGFASGLERKKFLLDLEAKKTPVSP